MPPQDLTPKTQTLPIFLCRLMALFLQCQHFIVRPPPRLPPKGLAVVL